MGPHLALKGCVRTGPGWVHGLRALAKTRQWWRSCVEPVVRWGQPGSVVETGEGDEIVAVQAAGEAVVEVWGCCDFHTRTKDDDKQRDS